MSCLETLKQKGLKLTPQRRLIIDVIHEAHSHLSAEDIISYVQQRMPGVNKSTIYRTLAILEEAKCIYKSESDNHCIYHHAEESHHHHLVCRCCGKSIDCAEDIFNETEKSIEERYGYKVHFHHMLVFGLCRDCHDKA